MSDAEQDYYEVLGVPRDADLGTIKAHYRHLAQRYHPDRNKAPDAEEKFKAIAKAYAVLHDPEKRAAYDARGSAGVAHFSCEDLFGGLDFGDLFADMGLSDSLFGRMFGMGRAVRRRGADIAVTLDITLERVAVGGEERVRYPREEPCTRCGGDGAEGDSKPVQCASCGGSGSVVHSSKKSGVSLQRITPCKVCNARGTTIERPCEACAGTGRVRHTGEITVQIPAGAREGLVLRVPGHGVAGPVGTPAGDLHVALRTRADPRFERRGADLWHELPVSIADAVLGARLEVPTLDGSARIVLPAGTQPGAVLRLRDKGLPRQGEEGRGDLLVVAALRVPEHLSDAQRRAYEALRDLDHRGRDG
jgi:molecular chaperone DnaJ